MAPMAEITLQELDGFVGAVQREFAASHSAHDRETEVSHAAPLHRRFCLVFLHPPGPTPMAAPIFCLVERTTGEIYNCNDQGYNSQPSGVHITWPDVGAFLTTNGVITASQALRGLEL